MAFSELSARDSFAQVAGLSKLPWGSIFGALQVALAAIPYLAKWLMTDTPETKAALCKLSLEGIDVLQFRCYAVALALDSNGDGPVIPPVEGATGIIPALADFVLKQDHVTISATRDACFRIYDASENLIKELGQGNWLTLLGLAGFKTGELQTLSEHLRYAAPRAGEFLYMLRSKYPVNSYDIEVARALAKQVSELPESAEQADKAIKKVWEKRQNTSCQP